MAGDSKPKVLFVLGAPGSGKGTQCTKIGSKYNFVHLSAGELLREECNTPGSPYGDMINTHLKDGTIVPVKITCSLLERAMTASSAEHFLIDGFPRNKDNLTGWNEEMSEKVKELGVLFFDCSLDECVRRCLQRGVEGSGRTDDNEESLRKRLVTFETATLPIVNHYKQLGLVYNVDGTRDPEIVFQDVQNVIQKIAPESAIH